MTITNQKLMQIAVFGGVIVASTGIYLQFKLIDRVRESDYYKNALRKLRMHPGAVHYFGEPIKDRRFKISDSVNNFSDENISRFKIPISGPKEKGYYYIWAEKSNDEWSLVKAELELKSKPDQRLIILKPS